MPKPSEKPSAESAQTAEPRNAGTYPERSPFQSGTRLGDLGQTLAAAYDHLLVEGVPDHLAGLVAAPTAHASAASESEKRLAIVVEDDVEVRALAEMVLEETPLEVIGCDSAERALNVLHDHGGQVALMFVDVRLPGEMNGIQLANAVATLWPKTRIVVTSGLAPDRLDPMPDQTVFMAKPWRAFDVLVEAERAPADTHRAVV